MEGRETTDVCETIAIFAIGARLHCGRPAVDCCGLVSELVRRREFNDAARM